jgi:hypothetical protein
MPTRGRAQWWEHGASVARQWVSGNLFLTIVVHMNYNSSRLEQWVSPLGACEAHQGLATRHGGACQGVQGVDG